MDGGTIVACLGVAIISCVPIHAVWTFVDTRLRWTIAWGTVVRTGQREVKDPEGGVKNVFYPVIRVRLANGETVQFDSHYTSSVDHWVRGDPAKVRVRASVVEHFELWLQTTTYLGWVFLGFIVVLMGVLPPER